MTLHADLLEQARHLANREKTRPRQASLRRAVSSAYYALFHLLTDAASRLFVTDPALVASVNRTFGHAEMSKSSKLIAAGKLPKALAAHAGALAGLGQLRQVATTFSYLQQARHEADYNLAKRFTRTEVRDLIFQVEQAFRDWRQLRKTDFARLYLASFLLWGKWDQ